MWWNSLLSRYKLIHEKYLKKILFSIYQSEFRDIIWFKWWTLAYLYYWLPRFSTDIDIDLLDNTKEQEVISFLEWILEDLWRHEKILGKWLHRWRFSYNQEWWIIKIELNKRENHYTKYEWIDIDWVNILSQDKISMASNKLQALWTRRYNRDLYDIHYFLSNWFKFDEKIILDRTWLSLNEWINHIIQWIPSLFIF